MREGNPQVVFRANAEERAAIKAAAIRRGITQAQLIRSALAAQGIQISETPLTRATA